MALRIHELFYDPLSIAYDEGRFGSPIGGHSDHVHVSFADPRDALLIIGYAQAHGLRVGENPYVGDPPGAGIHTASSYHYRNFPDQINGKTLGMAVDVAGTPAQMAGFATWVKGTFTGGTNSATAGPPGAGIYPPSSSVGSTGLGTPVSGASCLVVALAALGAAGTLLATLIAVLPPPL